MLATYLSDKTTLKRLFFLCALGFFVRGALFFVYLKPNILYRQADSMDYHFSALGLANDHGMHHIGTKEPIFWRVPGYPWYLSLFYPAKKLSVDFSHFSQEHTYAILLQILLCSLTPILAFFLALLLTGSSIAAWAVAGIFSLHLGFMLASCYLLTDALAMLFFLIFLYCFFYQFKNTSTLSFFVLAGSALSLALMTWMRPNGEFIALTCTILLLLSAPFRISIPRAAIFFVVFFAAVSPWYVRNYQLTGKCFFCPMLGPYLQAFNAPKIMRRVLNKPLEECLKMSYKEIYQEILEHRAIMQSIGSKKIVPKELMCLPVALTWIKNYPHYFIYDWTKEVLKTTFDLYTSQLVSCHRKEQICDPAEEFLSIKLYDALINPATPLPIRFIGWFELFFYLCIWIGFFGSIVLYLRSASFTDFHSPQARLYLAQLALILCLVGMTGGFGYARLRMPAEPLIIIISLMFWVPLIQRKIQTHESIVRPVAV